jgi:hypothetical protein
MAEIVPITRIENLPEVFDLEADRTIPDRVLAWVGSDGIAELWEVRRPLTAAERQIVEGRVRLLRSALAPSPKAERNRLEGEVSLMLGGFTVMQKIDEVAARGIIAQYLQLPRDRPFWAIVEACRMVRNGKAGLPIQYCPNESEFNTIIRRLVSDYERRLNAAERLLVARVRPPPQGSKVELFATHPYLQPGAREARLRNPLSKRLPWVPRSLGELAAEAAKSTGPPEPGAECA